jgi:hypothetical protein
VRLADFARVHIAAGGTARIYLDVKVILIPPCIFHHRFSIENIQVGVRMTVASAPKVRVGLVAAPKYFSVVKSEGGRSRGL